MRSDILKEKQSKVIFFLYYANLHTKVAFIVRDLLFQIFYISLSKWFAIT